MDEQTPQDQEQPFTVAPFDTSPVDLSPAGGCGRVGLVGCGVLILLLGAAAIVFLLKADDFFVWTMGKLEAQITAVLPEDCTEEERERLSAAFSMATEAVQEGTVDPAALQELMGALGRSLPDGSGSISREQVHQLTILLERVAGLVPEEKSLEEDMVPSAIAAIESS